MRRPAYIALWLALAISAPAQELTYDSEEDVRYAPVIDITIDDEDIDIPVPSFIRRDLNRIQYNGADWTALRHAFANAERTPVSIVHIGDSHLQAGINADVTRQLLQYDFGNAGRGLITPLKLAGTNQPADYTFTSTGRWTPVKLMSRRWERPMGFTGVSVHPAATSGTFSVSTSERDDYNPFSSVTIFHGGRLTVTDVTDGDNARVHYRVIPSREYTQIITASQQTRLNISYTSAGDLTLYGASLSGDRPGLMYHTIGNNGATYATYNRIGGVGAALAPLEPNLVIVSLGTNEAFGTLDTEGFYRSVDILVKGIQAANPGAQLLLVTPIECQRKVTKNVKKRVRQKGKKKRYKTVTEQQTSYTPNANIAPLRDVLLQYGRDNGVAVLDWYAVAGGAGASTTWLDNKLYGRDRVHHTARGYSLQGRLLYDALITALTDTRP